MRGPGAARFCLLASFLLCAQGWEEVGGLGEVKAALREALELPARAPALVACAPLRLRTGALLYGPPGCGKTHAVRQTVGVFRCAAICAER